MTHIAHPYRIVASRLLLIALVPAATSCHSGYDASDYHIHMIGVARIDNDVYPAAIHFTPHDGRFEGFYAVTLPDRNSDRSFNSPVNYYPSNRTFQVHEGTSQTIPLNSDSDSTGTLLSIMSDDSLHFLLLYDRLASSKSRPFIGYRLTAHYDSLFGARR